MKKINRGIDAPLVPLIFTLASLMALFFCILAYEENPRFRTN